MRRSTIKIILIVALVSCAAIGLRQAQGQHGAKSNQGIVLAAASSRPLEDSTVHVRDGSFILKNLTLTKMMGSTILKGNVVNKTNRKQEGVSFEVRAYDRNGQVLRGLETRTIFVGQQLKANAATPINNGYGVWLQGISLDSIAKLEISQTSAETTASLPPWTKWFAAHAVVVGTRTRDSEIEE
jgi:hypothetical protein